MGVTKSFSIIAVTAITIAAGALILSTSYFGNGTAQSFSSILGLDGNSGSVGIAEAAILPLDVDENFRILEKSGDGKTKASSFVIDTDHVDPDQHCEFCMRIEFNPGDTGKGGIVLKSDRAFDLDKATRIAFFVRGENGGEDVQFKAAGKEDLAGSEKVKFSFVSETTKLQNDWQKIEMDLKGKDLKAITHAFAVDLGKSDLKNSKEPIVIYLKGITFDEVSTKQSLKAAATTSS